MLSDLLIRLRFVFRRHAVERELDDEIRFHFEEQVEKYVRSGLRRAEATRRARLEFGGMEQVKEECREARGVHFVETLAQDIRYGLRMLRKSPGFTAVAVLTLALGIGANTAIFSILEAQLWRALPFPDAERLVDAHTVLRENPKQWDVLSARGFQAWREQNHSFANLTGYSYPGFRNLTANGTSERVMVMAIGANFFNTLEVPIERGRHFLEQENSPGRDHVAILSGSLWQDRFGSDPAVIGHPIIIDGESYTVVGIAAPKLRFEYIEEPAIFVPLTFDLSGPVFRNLYAIGRLAPGVMAKRAAEELTAILEREMKSEGVKAEDIAAATNLREEWTSWAARPLYFFAGAVALVLLIACINTAGLLLARGLARQREFALRAALGAGRGRIVRQLLVESTMLALAGASAGALAGVWLAQWFAAFMPEEAVPRHTPVTLDARLLAFTIAIAILSALIVGIAPGLFASRTGLDSTMRQGAPGRSASRGQRRTRSSLVAVEVALGLLLLFGAGLFLASFVQLEDAPRGFDAPGALTFRVSLRGDRYTKPEQMQRYFEQLAEQLRSLTGVRALTLGSGLPLTGSTDLWANVSIAGRPPVKLHGVYVTIHAVAPNYFQALHMRLLAGRAFSAQDTETAPRIAILSRNAAQAVFGSESPIGKVLNFVADERRGVPAEPPVEIVGVSENAQEFGADEMPQDDMYLPFAQHPVPGAYVLISSSVPRGALAGAIRDAAYALDKDQPIYDMKTMDDRVGDSLRGARFNLLMVGALAAVAIILVSVGTFGTVAYFVQQRTQEFGIRLALGASPSRILRHAIAQSLTIGFTGLSIGIAASLALGRLLRHALYLAPHEHVGMLYGVKIYDPLTLICACLLLTGVLVAASYVPARRAAKVDPLVALRYE